MQARYFEVSKDYATIANWWNGHNWPIVAPDFLPKLGLIIEDEEHKYCCGWLYRTDSLIAWVEFIVSNPKAPMKKRSEAINLLIEELLQKARQMGYGCVFTSVSQKGLMRRFAKQGFVVGDTNITQMTRKF